MSELKIKKGAAACCDYSFAFLSDPGRNRTCDRLIRSQMLYPLSYWTRIIADCVQSARQKYVFQRDKSSVEGVERKNILIDTAG